MVMSCNDNLIHETLYLQKHLLNSSGIAGHFHKITGIFETSKIRETSPCYRPCYSTVYQANLLMSVMI